MQPGEPLQHITGTAPFRHLELAVGPGVFVPRPETETVVQYAIDALLSSPESAPVGIDLGTGSGAIALAMATEVPHARIFAAELSEDAHGLGEPQRRGSRQPSRWCCPTWGKPSRSSTARPPWSSRIRRMCPMPPFPAIRR